MKTAAIARTLFFAVLMAAVALPGLSSAQGLRLQIGPGEFRFEREDERANEGKRASCEVYAQISAVQAEANRKYNCGYSGERWDVSTHPHFGWCRFARRESLRLQVKERAEDLQRCFDRMGDFDEERREDYRDRY
ncbi:MAG: hypothetical protein ACLP7P_20455 [Rhodomicrobium sp.]